MSKTKTAPIDKNQLITDQLVALMERGVLPWKRPWKSGSGNDAEFQNVVTKHVYGGANPLWCLISNLSLGYESPYFCTFNQARQFGWTIKPGSKSCWIRFASSGTKEVESESGEKTEERFGFAKWSSVFSIDAIDDSKADVKIAEIIAQPADETPDNPDKQIVSIEEFITNTRAIITHGGSRAYYSPISDEIRLPKFEQFGSAAGYYSTVLHELGHMSGSKDRLAREGIVGDANFGSQKYAAEELVAELCACFVSSALFPEYLSIDLEHHASYLDSWLSNLKSDNTAFFRAISQAQKASKFLLDLGTKKADLVESKLIPDSIHALLVCV